jgi:hypothetical protein
MLFDNPEARSLLANRQRRTPCVLLLDRSYSMAGEKMRRLNAGFDVFRQDILRNPLAATLCRYGGLIRLLTSALTASL